MAMLARSLLLASGIVALCLLAAAGPSYRLGVLELGQAFALLRWAAVLGLVSVVVIIGYSFWCRPKGGKGLALAFSGFCGLSAALVPLHQLYNARTVPMIHDISTDLQNPPAFVDVLPLRGDAPNPPQYSGGDTAEQQRKAYPDIQPLVLNAPPQQVYQQAQTVMEELGWQLVSATQEQNSARIEATHTTFWFGFTDDVVVRIQTLEQGVRVDVRSKSRIGKSDVGKNAQRIESFLQALQRRFAE